MGKRSNFERNPRDYYPTPEAAVIPLIRHLDKGSTFCEPCAGNGVLINHLEKFGLKCENAWDIDPQAKGIEKKDTLKEHDLYSDYYITNPPWDRKILHPLIEHLTFFNKPTWLLFDADWAHTKQSSEYMPYCKKIVSVGRVKWIPDSKMTGKDNCAWYLFTGKKTNTEFIGR